MTSRERMLCAYRGGKPDRVPVYILGVYPLMPGWMETKDTSFKRLADYVAEKADMQHTWSPPQGVFGDQPGKTQLVGTEGEWEIHEIVVETPKGPLTSRTQVSTAGHPSLKSKEYVENEEDLARYWSIPYTPETQDASGFFEMDRALGDAGVTMALFRTHYRVGERDGCGAGSSQAKSAPIVRRMTSAQIKNLTEQKVRDILSLFKFGRTEVYGVRWMVAEVRLRMP